MEDPQEVRLGLEIVLQRTTPHQRGQALQHTNERMGELGIQAVKSEKLRGAA